MKRNLVLFAVVCLAVSFATVGCGAKKAETSRAAIDEAKVMETTQEKVDYLVTQAKSFYNSDDFQGVIDIAQYILTYLDKDSAVAKDLITKAKEQLQAKAQGMLDEAKKSFDGFGK